MAAPAADPLGLLLFFCFTGAAAGRLRPGASQLKGERRNSSFNEDTKIKQIADCILQVGQTPGHACKCVQLDMSSMLSHALPAATQADVNLMAEAQLWQLT